MNTTANAKRCVQGNGWGDQSIGPRASLKHPHLVRNVGIGLGFDEHPHHVLVTPNTPNSSCRNRRDPILRTSNSNHTSQA